MANELIIDYPGLQGYDGKAERCTYEFSISAWVYAEWELADKLIKKHIDELNIQGAQLLHLKVWRDIKPMQTDYRVEVTATASPIFWTPIILGVLALAILVVVWRIVEVVKDIDWGKAGVPVTIGAGAVLIIVGLIAFLLMRK